MVIIDVQRKRSDETIPPGEEYKMKYFSISRKFTRVTNGTNQHKTRPKVKRFKQPSDGFFEVYSNIIRENKKKWASLPFVD